MVLAASRDALNTYVPSLQVGGQVVTFLTRHLGYPIPSPAHFATIGNDFRKAVKTFAPAMASMALGPPAGLVPDIAGPKVYSTAELLRGYLGAAHRRRLTNPLWLPGKAARAVRAVGRRTWEDFLAHRVHQPRAA